MTAKNPTRTKKFEALLAVLGSEEAAKTAWNAANPDNQIGVTEVSADVQRLIDAGFDREAAEALIKEHKPEAKAEVEPELSPKDEADVLVAKRGFSHTKGRVYVTNSIIEAQVRVLKTGKPEVVDLPGERHTKAVVIFRTDDTTVAIQNLSQPS